MQVGGPGSIPGHSKSSDPGGGSVMAAHHLGTLVPSQFKTLQQLPKETLHLLNQVSLRDWIERDASYNRGSITPSDRTLSFYFQQPNYNTILYTAELLLLLSKKSVKANLSSF